MSTINLLVARNEAVAALNPTMVNLLIALIVLVIVGILSLVALIFLRRMRQSKKAQPALPMYNEKTSSNYRRLTINTRPDSVMVYNEKQSFLGDTGSPPDSPIPEIRITFPEEIDESGKRQSGRVVVVRVGETSIGLEPLQDDVPSYERENDGRFQSLDLDRIGGLKEKDIESKQWS